MADPSSFHSRCYEIYSTREQGVEVCVCVCAYASGAFVCVAMGRGIDVL